MAPFEDKDKCNVQDAFVIAVEQQARDRLEKLSALRKIKPVDMTKLSQELNDSTSPENGEDLNGIIGGSSIYVTSVPELSQKSLTGEKNKRNILIHNYDESQYNKDNDKVIAEENLPITEEELELKQDIIDNGHSEPINGTQNIDLFEAINENTNFSVNSKMSNNSSFNMENKPHREMAVDVPESFVATAKQSPRYPPPRQNGSAHRIRPYSDYSSSSDRSSTTKPSKNYNGPVKVTHTSSNSIDSSASNSLKKPSPNYDKTNHVDNSNVTVNGSGHIADENHHDFGQLDRIRKYQYISKEVSVIYVIITEADFQRLVRVSCSPQLVERQSSFSLFCSRAHCIQNRSPGVCYPRGVVLLEDIYSFPAFFIVLANIKELCLPFSEYSGRGVATRVCMKT
ncbi:hypothetical protein GQR58_009222 [Nymphon striatum]|nr:hypothetical protein GQR58_009222 [Nymphon striatum]